MIEESITYRLMFISGRKQFKFFHILKDVENIIKAKVVIFSI